MASTNPFETQSPPVDDLSVFTTVVSAMQRLSPEARARLFRTLTTFFDLESPASLPSTSTPSPSINTRIENERTENGFFSEDRTMSPKQFLLEKRPHSDVERVVCLAYYLTHYRDLPHFKTLDLSKLNTEAAQIKLSNPTVAVDNASRSGFLVQSGQGKKQISAFGELYVQGLPDRAAAKQAMAAARPRKIRSKPRSKTKLPRPLGEGA